MTTPTTAAWRKTLDGEDVYVQPDGWVWSHVMQGWFYAPDLSLQVPPPPLKTRLKDEAQRLRHGWPTLWDALKIRNGVRGFAFFVGLGYRLVLLALWLQVIFGWGIHNVVRSVQKILATQYFVNLAPRGQSPEYRPEGYWYDTTPTDARNVVGLLFFLLVSAALLYLLYMHVCYVVDSHKGNLLFGGIMAHAAWSTIKKARAHDAMVAVRDGTRAAGGH